MSKSKSGNILQEADILLGSEARFIDEEPNGLKAEQVDPNKPKSNILMDADTLFGSESRFIDDDPKISLLMNPPGRELQNHRQHQEGTNDP